MNQRNPVFGIKTKIDPYAGQKGSLELNESMTNAKSETKALTYSLTSVNVFFLWRSKNNFTLSAC